MNCLTDNFIINGKGNTKTFTISNSKNQRGSSISENESILNKNRNLFTSLYSKFSGNLWEAESIPVFTK